MERSSSSGVTAPASSYTFSGQTARDGSRQHVGHNYNTTNHFYSHTSRLSHIHAPTEHTRNNEALLDAAVNGQTHRLHRLLHGGADIDYANEDGMTALHLSVRHHHLPTVRALLEAGADPNQPARLDHTTPLTLAIDQSYRDLFVLLVENGAPAHCDESQETSSPLHEIQIKALSFATKERLAEVSSQLYGKAGHRVQTTWQLKLIKCLTKPLIEAVHCINTNIPRYGRSIESLEAKYIASDNPVADYEQRLRIADDIQITEAAIKANREMIARSEGERTTIQKATPHLSVFWKRNSVGNPRDLIIGFLDFLIDEETREIEASGSDERLKQLQEYRNQHKEEVRTLAQRVENGEGDKLLSVEVIDGLVKQLFTLVLYGSNIQDFVNDVIGIAIS